MNKISDLKQDSFFRLLLQGEPGSGKTTLACGLPGAFVIDIDGNLGGPVRYRQAHNLPLPVAYGRVDRNDDGSEIVVMMPDKKTINQPATMAAQWQRLDTLLGQAIADPECETIVIDSATGLADQMHAETRRANSSVKDGRQIYSFFLQDGKRLMSTLTRIRKHVVLTAHERVEQDAMTGTTNAEGVAVGGIKQYRIVWPGQLGDYIGAFFTNVWRTEIRSTGLGLNLKREYLVRTSQDTQHPGLKNDYELPLLWQFDWKQLESKLR